LESRKGLAGAIAHVTIDLAWRKMSPIQKNLQLKRQLRTETVQCFALPGFDSVDGRGRRGKRLYAFLVIAATCL
jgi:hypothetical protein